MSDIDEPVEQSENEAVLTQPEQQIKLKPLYRLFTSKLLTLLLTIVVMLGLLIVLFYQSNAQNQSLVKNQLTPLTQQVKRIEALQKADELVNNLLIAANAENYVSLHAKLIVIDRQLLQWSSSNEQLFQQWLNKHKSSEDIVSRIQDSHARNQQLKQSSIIQLQLMLFSMAPIIDEKLANQKTLHKNLQAAQARSKVSFSRANSYIVSAQYLNNLQKLQSLLAEILVSFEQLTMYTPIADFELLRLNVEQVFIQNKVLKDGSNTNAMIDVNQQIDTFEQIVLTEQRALAKWQGYIRLAQDYHTNLKEQQRAVNQLLLVPYEAKQASQVGVIKVVLIKLNIQLSNKNITVLLVLVIVLSLLFFCYLLWRLREQIKLSAQEGVEIIQNSLQKKDGNVVANCAETQAIMAQLQKIAKPEHSEQEFQAIAEQYQSSLQFIEQKEQELERIEKCNEQQQIDAKDQITNELQRYKHLEIATLPIIQQQQSVALSSSLSESKNVLNENNNSSVSTKLALLYQQLLQFHLTLEVQLEQSVLNLNDINLVDEIHAILFNKQAQQQYNDNQLFVSCDEQLLSQAKIDFRLFQQLIKLFIDISLDNCQASQLLLQVQLQDKSAGQQLVRFVANVKTQSSDALPSLISQLLEPQATKHSASPLIAVFNILLAKQHGKNIAAQLFDDGFQVSFELPLAVAATTASKDKSVLKNTKVMLLSNSSFLAELIENSVQSAKGKFEKLARIDSFQQQVNGKQLKRHKLDLLVIDNDMALNHLDLITQQINELPQSLQPKLMVLQSSTLSYDVFGLYSQAEHVLCEGNLLLNIEELLASDKSNNQLYPCEQFTKGSYIDNELPLLLAMRSPEHSRNLQRLLTWLGFQVQVVAHEAAQNALWQTGQFSLLISEFAQAALLEMTSTPLIDVGVFSLSDVLSKDENSTYFDSWHIGQLSKEATLAELITALKPWLKLAQHIENAQNNSAINENALEVTEEHLDESEEFVITEVASVLIESSENGSNDKAVFNFAQYLQHQGTVELALFMLDDYTQDNHQQLDALIEAIKAKNIEEAQLAISALAINAKILSAQELQVLCAKWSKLLTGSEIPSSLKKINALLKETRIALNEIDVYAEAI